MPGRLRSTLLATAPMPAPPVRDFSFTDFQVNNPTAPPPGDKLDSNFDQTNLAVTQQLTWASVSINSDGTIRDGIIDANNLVPGLFDDVSQDIIDTVQPLVDEAQSYAQSAQASKLSAEAEATSAATQAVAATDAANTATAAAGQATAAKNSAQVSAYDAGVSKGAAATSASDAAGSEDQAKLYTELAGAWAEHMPDTIPPEVLAAMAISGDHWSSRWWANQAAQAFGNAAWYYAGAGPVPPLTTATGDPLPIGAIWFDTSVPPGTIKIWNGVTWVQGVASALPPGSVSSVEILDGSIQTVDLADGSVTLAKLAPNSVNSSKIVDGSIDPVDLSAATLALINANPFDQSLNKADVPQFAALRIGGTTNAFAQLKGVGPTLQAYLADNSGLADFYANGGFFSGNVQTGTSLEVRNAGSAVNKVVVQHDSVNCHVFAQSGYLVLGGSGADTVVLGTTQCFPVTNNTVEWGIAANRWKKLWAVDGDFSGNLAVRAASPAWGANYPTISVGAGGGIGGHSVLGAMTMYSNVFFDGVNYKYLTADAGAIYQQNSGIHSWFTIPAGAVGANAVATERLRMDVNGNLGLGRTPEAWGPTVRAMGLGSGGSIAGVSGNAQIGLYSNLYSDGANYKYILADAGAALILGGGILTYYAAPVGAAGANAAIASKMSVDPNGNMLLAGSLTQNCPAGTMTLNQASTQFEISGFGQTDVRNQGQWTYGSAGSQMFIRAGGSGGVTLTSGATSWTAGSERGTKKHFAQIADPLAILRKLKGAYGLGRYLTDEDSTPLRPFVMYEETAAAFPSASAFVPEQVQTDEETGATRTVPEHKGVSLESYVPLLLALCETLADKLDATEARLAALET